LLRSVNFEFCLGKENPDLMEGDKGDGKEKEVRFRSSVANWPIFGQFDTEKAEKGLNS
jgi:hypothetical protein